MDNIQDSVNAPPVRLAPGLYLVATPIGNLRDITLRALDAFNAADMVVCEDTRVTAKLMNAYGLKKKLAVYNDHSDERQRAGLLQALAEGKRIALVSDAGTPLVSDPGYKLVRDALEQGHNVTALPGANAPLTALQLSGLPSDAFSFIGFLPPKTEARKKKLREWVAVPGTLIAFETGPRLTASLEAMLEVMGDRPAAVVRELTKLYEESRRGLLSELIAIYQENGPPKGEIVVVIGHGGNVMEQQDVDLMLEQAMADMSLRDAVNHVTKATGRAKKDVYARALEMANKRV
jgi:16S rRNA (cytidine1402-2'-O)-methyltransferase